MPLPTSAILDVLMKSHTLLGPTRLSVEECTAAQRGIDSEIAEVTPSSSPEHARMLRGRRNTYALINIWLPAELMAAIFSEIVATSQHMPRSGAFITGYQSYNFSRTWVAISHVCQSWRMLAVGTPQLWTNVSFANADVTTLMLQRSEPCPISINYCSWASQHESIPTLEIALSHSDRASEVSLNMSWDGLQDLVSKYLTKPLPLLKRLEIRKAPSDAIHHFPLPSGCLDGLDSLNHLVLYAVGFSPATLLPTTLTVLHIYRLMDRVTPVQMAVLLAPLENLRDLSLEHALRPGTEGPAVPSDVCHLSPRTSLARLCIHASGRMRNEFMARFPITSATLAAFMCFPETPEDVYYGQVLAPVYGAPGLLRGLSVSYSDAEPYGDKITVSGHGGTSFSMTPADEMFFSVAVIPTGERSFPSHETLRDLCDALPLDSVETLRAHSYDSRLEEGEVRAQLLASRLRGVRMLRAENEAVKHILHVMYPPADGTSPAFPHLCVLNVVKLSDSDDIGTLLPSIVDCLIARRASGKVADVKELVIDSWRVPPERLRDLESLELQEPDQPS